MREILFVLLFLASFGAIAQTGYNGTIYKATAAVAINNPAATPIGEMVLNATSSAGLPVVYESKTVSKCTMAGNVALLKAVGPCVILAKTVATATHVAGQTPINFNVLAAIPPPPPPAGFSISIASPLPGQSFPVDQVIEIVAKPVGTPIWVEFFIGGVNTCKPVAPPWTCSFKPTVASDALTLSLQANDGTSWTSTAPITIKITGPAPAAAWTVQQKYFAACGACPSTGKIETQSCPGYNIVATDGSTCINSAFCKWIAL
jgi:hypothetical protein